MENMTALFTFLGILEKLILFFLILLSVWSVSIIWERFKAFKIFENLDPFDTAKNILSQKNEAEILKWCASNKDGIRAGTIQTLFEIKSQNPEKADRAVKSYLTLKKNEIEKGFTTLATLGSNAPFIGLLGTVLGIIQAFGLLSGQKSDTNALMASISFALVATAAGLFVAIPAVIAYNTFNRKVKILISECEALKDHYLSIQKAEK